MLKSNFQLTENSKLQLQTHSVLRDDLVCFNKLTGEVITLNSTGYLFLKLLNGQRSINEVTTCLADKYGNDINRILPDALEFYTKMISSDIIKIEQDE